MEVVVAMFNSNVQTRRALLTTMALLVSFASHAAGFEKNVLWSGKYQGYGGAAASTVNDSEALFFNPAGLAAVEGQGDVRLNFSPTFSKFSGPTSTVQNKDSEQGFSPVGAATAAYRLNPKYVLGLGAFVSGGTNTKYKNVEVAAPFSVTDGSAESHLTIIDFTLGAAANVSKEFSVGAAWRATYATAELASTNNLAEVRYTGLKSWDYSSFRLGAQYHTDDLGVGLNIRTPVKLTLEGEATARGVAPPLNGQFSDVTVSSEFPMLIALGGDYKIASRWKLLGEISWANYGANDKLDIEVPGNATLSGADIDLKWRDQWVGRVGTEWQVSERLTARAGYVLTSKVTSDRYARATFGAPGLGHTFCLGAGMDFGALDVEVAADYSTVSGSGSNVKDGYSGDFKTKSYTAHLGVGYSY